MQGPVEFRPRVDQARPQRARFVKHTLTEPIRSTAHWALQIAPNVENEVTKICARLRVDRNVGASGPGKASGPEIPHYQRSWKFRIEESAKIILDRRRKAVSEHGGPQRLPRIGTEPHRVDAKINFVS
jgi:hypothetical protein